MFFECYRFDLVNLEIYVKFIIFVIIWVGIWKGGRIRFIMIECDITVKKKGFIYRFYLKIFEEEVFSN